MTSEPPATDDAEPGDPADEIHTVHHAHRMLDLDEQLTLDQADGQADSTRTDE